MSVDAHRFVGRGATIGDMPPASNDVRGNSDASKSLLAVKTKNGVRDDSRAADNCP
ncbi:hypothetical protein [Rhodanobacter sp. C05]|uniref:hypothetical protein n=1 Tax=Rhodanobacter sp. C05 TaxID=1945855 RepID=UPI00143BB0AD|nr:hypothetical protein [Rhodanobacter sp. C05]